MSVVPYERRDVGPPVPSRAWVELLPEAVELAKAVADTEFVPKALRHNPAAIAACILYGDEVGIGPMQALAKIAMVDGKPTLAAESQRGLIISRGHEVWVEELTNTRVTWAGRRAGQDLIIRTTWTWDDAQKAGLTGKNNWKNYPRQMLSARASADLARAHFSDVIGGLAAAEEVDDGSDPAASQPAAGDGPSAPRRRRRQSPSAALGVGPPPSRPAVVEGALPPLPGEYVPEDVVAPEAMTEPQLRRMQALMRERGVGDRRQRLDFCTHVIGRPIASSRQLTSPEASRVIAMLELNLSQPPAASEEAGPPAPHDAAPGTEPTPPAAAETTPDAAAAPPADEPVDPDDVSVEPPDPDQEPQP